MKKVLQTKIEKLEAILREMKTAILAYSGGVDSSFLLFMMKKVMGNNVIAVTAISPTFPERDLKRAKELTHKLKVNHIIVHSCELENENFRKNPPQRCYYCKKELFSILKEIAREKNIKWICDGSNTDDTYDYRPGRKAGEEFGVRSPLIEAGFSKSDIRTACLMFSLPYHDEPASPCLASRFPYGEEITIEKLNRVARAEEFLREKGFKTIRVRHIQNTAKIEVAEEDLPKILEIRNEVVSFFKTLGFIYITLDLEGYRSGSMNKVLEMIK